MIGLWQRFRKPVLTVFILAHIIGLSIYAAPRSSARDALLAPFLPYMRVCGLEQTWTVFAPNPPQWSTYLSADIEFADGTSKEWEFPRIEKMALMDKVPSERFRKWANDNMGDAEQAPAWPDTIRYVARLHKNPSNPPVFISLLRHRITIPDPSQSNMQGAQETTELLYTGKVDARDLE